MQKQTACAYTFSLKNKKYTWLSLFGKSDDMDISGIKDEELCMGQSILFTWKELCGGLNSNISTIGQSLMWSKSSTYILVEFWQPNNKRKDRFGAACILRF